MKNPIDWPTDTVKFPRKGVVGEIKPHNERAIRAGIRQLVKRTRHDGHRRTPQLLTYRRVSDNPPKYEVLAADPDELRKILATWRPGALIDIPKTWYRMKFPVAVPAAGELIPLWKCPTQLGNLVERTIRDKYAMQLGISLPYKHPSATGADIEHEMLEMAEFLRELAAELEAEAGY